MKVKSLIEALQKCNPEDEVKVLGEVAGNDLDINPSVVVRHPAENYVALLPDYGDVDEDEGEEVIFDESGESE